MYVLHARVRLSGIPLPRPLRTCTLSPYNLTEHEREHDPFVEGVVWQSACYSLLHRSDRGAAVVLQVYTAFCMHGKVNRIKVSANSK